jgi:hypothetical protein
VTRYRHLITDANRKWWTLGAMCFALFMIMLDNTVVNVALPSIERDLGASLSSLEWTINGYTLAFAVLLATGGRLGDIFGRRRTFLIGVILFSISSATAGLAPDTTALVASRVVQGIGGDTGYYSLPGAWAVRGVMDKLAGGVGLRRGRRSRQSLALGDALDWWRVEELVPNELLRLRAEMRVPGRAWLELSVKPIPGGSLYRQRAVFFPHGLAGRLYWLSILPFHGVIFSSMARRITTAAENLGETRNRD